MQEIKLIFAKKKTYTELIILQKLEAHKCQQRSPNQHYYLIYLFLAL